MALTAMLLRKDDNIIFGNQNKLKNTKHVNFMLIICGIHDEEARPDLLANQPPLNLGERTEDVRRRRPSTLAEHPVHRLRWQPSEPTLRKSDMNAEKCSGQSGLERSERAVESDQIKPAPCECDRDVARYGYRH